MISSGDTDVIVWAIRGYPNAARNPQAFGWIDASGDVVNNVSVKKPLSSFILSSILSKDNPSPSAKSARPPKSARDKSFTTPGALTTLKFSIINFEEDFFFVNYNAYDCCKVDEIQ